MEEQQLQDIYEKKVGEGSGGEGGSRGENRQEARSYNF